MKHLILILTAVFFLFPLAAVASPDQQPVSMTEEFAQNAQETEAKTVSVTGINASENPSAQWREDFDEIVADRIKEENHEDTREAIAEDIILGN